MEIPTSPHWPVTVALQKGRDGAGHWAPRRAKALPTEWPPGCGPGPAHTQTARCQAQWEGVLAKAELATQVNDIDGAVEKRFEIARSELQQVFYHVQETTGLIGPTASEVKWSTTMSKPARTASGERRGLAWELLARRLRQLEAASHTLERREAAAGRREEIGHARKMWPWRSGP